MGRIHEVQWIVSKKQVMGLMAYTHRRKNMANCSSKKEALFSRRVTSEDTNPHHVTAPKTETMNYCGLSHTLKYF